MIDQNGPCAVGDPNGNDCYVFARTVLHGMGLSLPASPAHALLARESIAEPIPAGERPRGGDIVLMELVDGTQHVGVCTGPERFVHATRAGGATEGKIANYEKVGKRFEILRLKAPAAAAGSEVGR